MTIHNSLPDREAAERFDRGIRKALEAVPGDFAAWVRLKRGDQDEVEVHLEEPARKETLGNVVEPWKRSTRLTIHASEEEVRRAIGRLLGS